MIRWVLLSAVCLVGASVPLHAQTAEDAERFVRGVYAKYYPLGDSKAEPYRAADVVTPSLAALFTLDGQLNERFQEIGAINADPFCDCQDDDGLRVTLVKASLSGTGRATANVSMRFPPGTYHSNVRLLLKSSNGEWRVDDFVVRGASVRQALAESNACRQRSNKVHAAC